MLDKNHASVFSEIEHKGHRVLEGSAGRKHLPQETAAQQVSSQFYQFKRNKNTF